MWSFLIQCLWSSSLKMNVSYRFFFSSVNGGNLHFKAFAILCSGQLWQQNCWIGYCSCEVIFLRHCQVRENLVKLKRHTIALLLKHHCKSFVFMMFIQNCDLININAAPSKTHFSNSMCLLLTDSWNRSGVCMVVVHLLLLSLYHFVCILAWGDLS